MDPDVDINDPPCEMRDMCWSHNVNEPANEETYRICFECNHVFQTEDDLVNAHNAKVEEMRMDGPGGDFEWEVAYIPLAQRGSDIHCCPFCIHDF